MEKSACKCNIQLKTRRQENRFLVSFFMSIKSFFKMYKFFLFAHTKL